VATAAPVATAVPPVAAAAASLEIGVKGDALEFNKTKLSAKAGAAVVLTFNNVSAINQHNWVIVPAGAKDTVAARGVTAGPANNWVQSGDSQVIANTPLVDPGKTGEVRFAAPAAGRYQFVCTFPGHNFTMFGDFEVTP
jgi:azurin